MGRWKRPSEAVRKSRAVKHVDGWNLSLYKLNRWLFSSQ